MKIKDSNVTINVVDIDKSISFYKSIGFSLKNRWDNHYAELKAPGITIGLHPSSNSSNSGSSGNLSIGFTSENFNEIREDLNNLEIEVVERIEEGGEFLHFTDLDGTSLYFINPKW